MEKLGRRPLLLGGGVVMAICLFVVGGLGFKASLPGAALVALTCIWTAAYALSAGPLGEHLVFRVSSPSNERLEADNDAPCFRPKCSGWSYVAETASPRLRAKTAGIAASGTCIFGLIFNYTVPIMLSPQQANWGIKIGQSLVDSWLECLVTYSIGRVETGLFFGGLCTIGLVIIWFFVPEASPYDIVHGRSERD